MCLDCVKFQHFSGSPSLAVVNRSNVPLYCPGAASLLQVKVTSKEMKQMALATLELWRASRATSELTSFPWHSRARRSEDGRRHGYFAR